MQTQHEQRTLTMPKLGMTMTEGTVVRWLLSEGARFEKGEPLVEVMTDKVNLEVEAPCTGQLLQILAGEGETLEVGAPLALLLAEGRDPAAAAAAATSAAASALAAAQRESSPSSSSTPTTVAVPPPTAASTPSSGQEAASEDARIASTPAAKREAALHAIDLRAVVAAGFEPPLTRDDVLAFMASQSAPATAERPDVRATPLARKMARDHQLDLAALAVQKRGEKVTRADVETALALRQQQEAVQSTLVDGATASVAATSTRPQASAAPTPVVTSAESEEAEVIPLSPARRLIGQRMLASVTTMPHIYLDLEIDMSEAERCRQHLAASLSAQGDEVPSLTAIIIRAVAAALRASPEVNATLDDSLGPGKEVIRRWRAVHIGVAVDTGQSLLTPVIRHADRQSLPELARNLRRLVEGARAGKLSPDDLSGATFTISNLGMYGIDTFHAIIPPGQSAILAVGKVTRRGVVVEERKDGPAEPTAHLEIRPVMKVSLSADHRVLDGATGSRFLQRCKQLLENPYLLL
ncbi:MAG: 2-oxo acid dehydrogenase subunit E2 [Thermogemmatispora sp.]|uniref:dihydrolipoamide acetyltransferase family protein n=1 Tax=Thermogemmatispora sp. TaxID=1968838 RepID=UPI00262D633D|nr:dihydrolipoamide acetyltransferase family protein [Thermogemmatispora sp.]MBX5456965.1 2-oxo acid dehydrogenase subunit E2 [Thermogemmatispora sp.]